MLNHPYLVHSDCPYKWQMIWQKIQRMKKTFILIAAVLAGLATTATAQLVDCDIFLKGNHMEIGIASNGAFGASIEAPVGYHANVTDTLYNDCTFMSFQVAQDLGFVADPNLTGWTSYYGDFIMPGNPREGWAMENTSGAGTAYSYNYYTGASAFTGPLSGANTTYTATGGTLKGSWTGAFDSIAVNQVTTIDTGNLYLLVHVGFYNAGSAPDSFYYLRFINPHNEQVTSSNPNTRAKIEHQLPNTFGLVVVSATGLTDTLAYLALGTRDPRARCFIAKDSSLPGPATLRSIWTGDTAYNYTDTLTGNHAIGLVYRITLGPGDSSYLDYGYSFKGGIIDTVLDTALHGTGGGGGGTLATNHIAQDNVTTLYPNPAGDYAYISGVSATDNVIVYDITGREMNIAGVSMNKAVVALPLHGLASGSYIVVVRDGSGAQKGRHVLSKM